MFTVSASFISYTDVKVAVQKHNDFDEAKRFKPFMTITGMFMPLAVQYHKSTFNCSLWLMEKFG